MPDWFSTLEIEDISLTAKVFNDETIARNPEIRAVRVNIQPHSIQGPSNPVQRDFAGPLRGRQNMSVGGLVGSARDLESSPTFSVGELVSRFEGGARSSIRQRIGFDAVASANGIASGRMPHAESAIEKEGLNESINPLRTPRPFKNELIKKVQARNLSLFGSLEPSFNLANYPEYPFQNPSLDGAIYQPLHFKAARTRVLPVRVPPPPPPPPPAPPLGLSPASTAAAIWRILENRRFNGYADYSDSSDESSIGWSDE
ncbi:hypothetical protein ACTOV4_12625 [Brucella sp. C7-11G]